MQTHSPSTHSSVGDDGSEKLIKRRMSSAEKELSSLSTRFSRDIKELALHEEEHTLRIEKTIGVLQQKVDRLQQKQSMTQEKLQRLTALEEAENWVLSKEQNNRD